jgi:hypothetical protein
MLVKLILTCKDNRIFTASNNRSGSILSPTTSGGIIEKSKQHCEVWENLVRNIDYGQGPALDFEEAWS